MPDQAPTNPENVSVQEFLLAPELGLDLEVVVGGEGLANSISSPRVQKLGLALAGFAGYVHPERVQLFGGSEWNYLNTLAPGEREESLRRLASLEISCIVITRGLEIPPGFEALARAGKVAVLRTAALSSVATLRITDFLEGRLAPRLTVHGVFLEIFGLGVMILGPSGIGKSECALELVLRGHRLISDDSVEITRRGVEQLVGAGGPVLKHHMELRGLGIIDIKEIFGISATGDSHALDFVVRLERWNPDGEYDRLGLDRKSIEFLGVPVPLMETPVAPGRLMSTLVEVAARAHLLRKRGYRLSAEVPGSQS